MTEEAIPDRGTRTAVRRSIHEEILQQVAEDRFRSNVEIFARFPDYQSTYQTPGLAVADVDDDGWEDVYLARYGPYSGAKDGLERWAGEFLSESNDQWEVAPYAAKSLLE